MNGTTLVNKANVWKSDDEWNLESARGRMVYLENASKGKVLGVEENVVRLNEYNKKNKWEKGESNREGYFTLTNPHSQQD